MAPEPHLLVLTGTFTPPGPHHIPHIPWANLLLLLVPVSPSPIQEPRPQNHLALLPYTKTPRPDSSTSCTFRPTIPIHLHSHYPGQTVCHLLDINKASSLDSLLPNLSSYCAPWQPEGTFENTNLIMLLPSLNSSKGCPGS